MSVRTRPALVADAAPISGLMTELGYGFDEASLAEKLQVSQSDYRAQAFVAVEDDRVVGVVSLGIMPLFHAEGSLGRITSLIVTESSRAHGAGKLLVAAAERYAWEHGCAKIEVTSSDHRKVAHDFYATLDYNVDEQRFSKDRPPG